jgi:hypothetical protein
MKTRQGIAQAKICIFILSVLLFAIPSNVWAAYPYSMTYTVSAGDSILADHYNTANNEHINNNIPESIDDYSANATEMQSTRDPYPSSVVSLATSDSEEKGGMRYQLDAIIGGTYWYEDAPTFMTDRLATDFDFGTNSYTLGGSITFDVAGSGIGTDGSINFGTNTFSLWSDGTDGFGTSTGDISMNAWGNAHIFQSAAVTQATIDDTGMDIITGNAYMINATSVLDETTLGSGILNSSLTSVGTLAGLAATGAIDFGAADSFEMVNSAAPTVDAIGEWALDTTVTGHHQGLMTYFGTEPNYIVSFPTSNLTTTDGHIVAYNAANDEFEMVAPASSGASTALDNLASVAINTSLISDTDITDDLGTGDIRFKDGWLETLSSGLTAADTLKLRARDVDGAAYVDILTITSANDVTADLWASTTIGSNAIADASDDLSFFSSTTSAQLLALLSDETGTNTAVFSDDATLVRPAIGVATGTSLDLGGTTSIASRSIIVDTGGVLDINLGTSSGDDFTIDTTTFTVEGDSRNIGIGTAAPSVPLNVYVDNATTASQIIKVEQDGAGDCGISFDLTASTQWAVGVDNSDSDKFIISAATDLGSPILVLDGTNIRMSIGTTSLAQIFTAEGSINNDYVALYRNTHATNPFGLLIDFSAASPDDNTKKFLECTDSTTTRLNIFSDGDITNHDGTYGTISDRRLKIPESIVPAQSQLNDVMNVNIVDYAFITNPSKVLIGVVAQDLELIFPDMIMTSGAEPEKRDEQGAIIRRAQPETKSVKSSILYGPILMKAFQEFVVETRNRLDLIESRLDKLEAP